MKANADHPKTGEVHPEAKAAPMHEIKSLPMPELQERWGASSNGLRQAEAQKRRLLYGRNGIAEKKANPFLEFLSHFWGPIPWMIEASVVLSAVAGHWPDFGSILLLLIANAVVGFREEHQAGNAITTLQANLAVKARVKRDGKWANPPARELASTWHWALQAVAHFTKTAGAGSPPQQRRD